MKLLIPPPIYTALLMGIMWLLDRYLPITNSLGFPWNQIGIGLIILALVADLGALLLFIRANTTINPLKPHHTEQLVTHGSYRFSRNPMYLSMVVILLGWALWLGSLTPFFAIPLLIWTLTEMQIKPEEAILTQKFGNDYLTYQQHVRRWL